MVRESDIETYLIQQVALAKGEVRKLRFINRRGAPDRWVLLPWRHLLVELKAPGKKLDFHQAREHQILRRFGVEVVTIDSCEAVDDLVRRN